MNWNRHSELEGSHAFLSASKYHWINYDSDKLADSYNNHDIVIYGYDGTYVYNSGSASFEKTEDGYVLTGNKGFAAVYTGDDGLYLAASNALVTAPVTLVKKQSK